ARGTRRSEHRHRSPHASPGSHADRGGRHAASIERRTRAIELGCPFRGRCRARACATGSACEAAAGSKASSHQTRIPAGRRQPGDFPVTSARAFGVTTMRRARLCAAVATLMLAEAVALPAAAQTGSTPATGTQSVDVVTRADALFQDALKLYKAKKYAEAERGFLAAWALNPTYDVSGNLAYVEYHLGKYRDAAEFFEFTLRNFPVTAKADRRAAAQKKLDEVRKLVASVT